MWIRNQQFYQNFFPDQDSAAQNAVLQNLYMFTMVFGYLIVCNHLNCQFCKGYSYEKMKVKREHFNVFTVYRRFPKSECNLNSRFSTVTTVFQFCYLLKMVLVANCVILFCIQSNRRTKIDPGIFCN
jgi:hypothetical protein